MAASTAEFELEDELADIAGVLNVQHARLVDVAARARRDGGWFGEGIHSIAHWLTIHVGLAPARAKQVATIAERADEFPVLMATFRRGELAIDQVYEVAAKAPAWADQRVTEFATVATVRQLRRMIRDENFEGDPDEVDTEPERRSESISMTWDEHGRLRMPGALDTEQGLIVEAAMNDARQGLFDAGHTDVTWSDALAEIARRSLDTITLERRERFLPAVHVHLDTAAVQLTNGVRLPATLRDYLLCDANLRPVGNATAFRSASGAANARFPTARAASSSIAIRAAASRAAVSATSRSTTSCTGVTAARPKPGISISLCRNHHKRHHLGHLLITGNADTADGVQFSDALGRELAIHPHPRPPDAPPPAPPVPYRHPSGERLQPRWIDWAHPNAMRRRREQANALHRGTLVEGHPRSGPTADTT